MVGRIGTPSGDADGMLVGPFAVADAGLKSYLAVERVQACRGLGRSRAHWEVPGDCGTSTNFESSNVDKHTREGEIA